MASSFVFDISTLTEQITEMVKSCIEAARTQIINSIPEIQVKLPDVKHDDLAGIREQIHANACFLLPFFTPDAFKQLAVEPKLYVVISGTKPYIRAYVMVGTDALKYQSKLFYGDYADTTAQALEKLLKVTMALVDKSKQRIVSGQRFPVANCGGYYSSSPKMTPPSSEDQLWWGEHNKISPSFPAKSSFASTNATVDDDGSKNNVQPRVNINGGFEDTNNLKGSFNAHAVNDWVEGSAKHDNNSPRGGNLNNGFPVYGNHQHMNVGNGFQGASAAPGSFCGLAGMKISGLNGSFEGGYGYA